MAPEKNREAVEETTEAKKDRGNAGAANAENTHQRKARNAIAWPRERRQGRLPVREDGVVPNAVVQNTEPWR